VPSRQFNSVFNAITAPLQQFVVVEWRGPEYLHYIALFTFSFDFCATIRDYEIPALGIANRQFNSVHSTAKATEL
jgi:hypothetical protein